MKKVILIALFAMTTIGTVVYSAAAPAGCGISQCGGGNTQCCKDPEGNIYFMTKIKP